MLTAQAVKPLLVHEDRPVRDAAVDYFKGSWSQDADLVPLILQAYRQYGPEECLHGVACCSHFVLTPQSVDGVLDCLATAKDRNIVFHLNRALANAPVDVLLAKEAEILETAQLGRETVAKIKQRLEFSQWSPGQALGGVARLRPAFRRQAVRQRHRPQLRRQLDHRLGTVRRARRRHDLWFAGGGEGRVQVAGDLSHRPGRRAASSRDDSLAGQPVSDRHGLHAGMRDGFPRGKSATRRRCDWSEPRSPTSRGGSRTISSAVLADIKHQESEDALLALLESEPNATIRTRLCVGLCELFSEAGIEVVRREIARGYDRSVVSLEETLLPVAHVLGVVLPEADRWRAEQAERERMRTERRAELEELGRRYQAAKAAGIDPFARLRPKTELKTEPGKSATARRATRRVGRNEPCPCGSGKKYKKCCGRNAT